MQSKSGKQKKQQKVIKSGNARKARRATEDAELEELEARVVAEAPKRGEGLGLGLQGAAPGAADGPALTAEVFKDLPISYRTKRGLKEAGFVRMTEVQRGAIPHALCGRDVLGEARTGSGKTLAFLVPLLELLFRRKWSSVFGLGGLIVSPTRELSYQIYQVLTKVGAEHEFSGGCVVGGRSLQEEQKAVGHMNILVATPGRLLQHLDESPGFEAGDLQMMVLDEADRILDLGFQDTVTHILGHLPSDRQTLLFSATLHTSVHRLGRAALSSPEMVSVHKNALSRTPERLKQVYMVAPLDKKVDLLFSFLRSHSSKKIIVFVSACKQVRFFYEAFRLLKPGLLMMELHGRQSLAKRLIVFQQFTEREGSVALVCTDVAARGVDFPVVDWVVQVDCPDSVDSYIHRVGRTARYESGGQSALFLLPSEEKFVQKLQAAKINAQSISPKSSKLVTIQGKLAGLLAGNADILHLAQKAFATYVRSVKLMRDKDVFDAQQLDTEAFATSLGLSSVPDLGSLDLSGEAGGNSLRKQKNMTPLQRLKEKIKAKKEANKLAGEGAAAAPPDSNEEEELEEDRAAATQKKGRWARRQRRIASVAAAAKAGQGSAEQGAREDDEELLQPTGNTEQPEVAAVSSGKRRQKLQRDGKAQGAEGQHVFFGQGGSSVVSELSQLAGDLGGGNAKEQKGPVDRQAFLQRVAKDLAERDVVDAEANRARLHGKKKRRNRLDRQARQQESGGLGPELMDGEASSRSSSPAPRAASPSPASEPEETLPKAKRRRATPAKGQAPAEPVQSAALDSLQQLEREALSRLGGGGLFG